VSEDQFGHHVVQYLLEHGSPIKQSIMVCKFVGRIASMCRHESDSKVIQKWLAFGNQQDRQLITNEIMDAGGHTSWLVFLADLCLILFPFECIGALLHVIHQGIITVVHWFIVYENALKSVA
jgi:hypothetical protein